MSSTENSMVHMQANSMFATGDALRAAAHKNIDQKDYDVADLYRETGIVQAIARHSRFGTLTLSVICLNACWIGLDAECNNANDGGREVAGCVVQSGDEDFWRAGENIFCAFFSLELFIRFLAFQSKWSALRDNWFKFDSVLVAFMVFETWIVPLMKLGEGVGNLDLLRMLRLLRLTRMVRLMRSVPELVTLMKGMVVAVRSVGFTLLLLLIILYIFSIVFKSQLVDTEVEDLKKPFGSILRSMWTLLLTGCLMDDIAKIGDLLVKHNIFMAFVFLIFVLLSSLMVLNMLIGVLCAVVTAVAAAEKEKSLVNYVKSKLITVLHRLDEDGNGTISKGEFDQLVHIPEAVSALTELGVDVPNLMSLADFLFEDDSAEQSSKSSAVNQAAFSARCGEQAAAVLEDEEEEEEGISMTFAEFLEMVIRLRSENQPSVADIVELRKLIYKGQRQVQRRIEKIGRGQAELRNMVQLVHVQLDAALELSEEFIQASDMGPELQAIIDRETLNLEMFSAKKGSMPVAGSTKVRRRPKCASKDSPAIAPQTSGRKAGRLEPSGEG